MEAKWVPTKIQQKKQLVQWKKMVAQVLTWEWMTWTTGTQGMQTKPALKRRVQDLVQWKPKPERAWSAMKRLLKVGGEMEL